VVSGECCGGLRHLVQRHCTDKEESGEVRVGLLDAIPNDGRRDIIPQAPYAKHRVPSN